MSIKTVLGTGIAVMFILGVLPMSMLLGTISSMAGLPEVSLQKAFAHKDPATCSTSGIGISMAVTDVNGGAVEPGDILSYTATLGPGPLASDCAYEGSTWTITTPDGVDHDISASVAGKCIKGTTSDVAPFTCSVPVSSVTSSPVDYKAKCEDIKGGLLTAETDFIDHSHFDTDDTPILIAGSGIPIPMECIAATELTKTPDKTSGPAPFTVTYTYDDHNSGDVPLDDVSQSDDKCSPVTPVEVGGINIGDTNSNGLLDPSEHWIFTCTITYKAPADCGPQTNTATFVWRDLRTGALVEEKASATVTVECIAATELTKTPDKTSGPAPFTVTYTYEDHNSGDVPLDDVSQSDNKCSPVTPVEFGGINVGDIDGDGLLDPSEHWIFTCTITYKAPADCGTQTNTATFVWLDLRNGEVRETALATVTVECIAATELTKKSDKTSGPAPFTVTYTYEDHNSGDVPLDDVSQSDNKCSPVTPVEFGGINVGDIDGDGLLDPSETWIFTCTTTYKAPADCGTQTNTATFVWLDLRNGEVRETALATVTVNCEDLTDLIKSASVLSGPAPLTVTYTYDDHNSGTAPLTPVSQTDNRCTPLVRGLDSPGNNDLVFEPSEHWIFTCTITYEDPADCGPQTNTATFTWASQTGGPNVVETDKETVRVICVVIGGEILPIDMTTLFVAGAFTNAFWILPVLGAIAGAVIAVTRFRRENGED